MKNGFGQLAQCDPFMSVIVHAPLSNEARIQQTNKHTHTNSSAHLCETTQNSAVIVVFFSNY